MSNQNLQTPEGGRLKKFGSFSYCEPDNCSPNFYQVCVTDDK